MKAWGVVAYTNEGAVYCRDCVAEFLEDKEFSYEYPNTEHDDYPPIFSSDLDNFREDGLECEYCYTVIYEGE